MIKYHGPSGLNNRCLFLMILEVGKSNIKVPTVSSSWLADRLPSHCDPPARERERVVVSLSFVIRILISA